MSELSPAAQAVLDAYRNPHIDPALLFNYKNTYALAAVLRAAADQVVPEEGDLNPLNARSIHDWNHINATRDQREEIRRQILAIADELEAQ